MEHRPESVPPDHQTAGPAVRGEVGLAGHRRVSHGLFLPLAPGLTEDEEFLRDLVAWRLVLPGDAVFTHVTAARVLGWQLPALPSQVPVFAAVRGDLSRPQRPGLIYSRLVREPRVAMVRGVPVDAPEELMLRAARDLGLLDLTIMVDSARRRGDLDHDRMQAILASGRPGVRMLGKSWSLSDHRADSAGETLLRVFHKVLDIPVTPQATLVDERGLVIGRADLLIDGTQEIQEYDGEVHGDRRQRVIDLRRERGLSGTSYHRHGYVLDDLLNHPITVMHEIDRLLGRPHRMSRARRWQRLVDNSLYREQGRERVLNRRRRVNGIIDWSETA